MTSTELRALEAARSAEEAARPLRRRDRAQRPKNHAGRTSLRSQVEAEFRAHGAKVFREDKFE